MKIKENNRIFILIICIIVIIIVFFIVSEKKHKKNIELNNITNFVQVRNAGYNDKNIEIKDLKTRYKIIFVTKSKCMECYKKMPFIERVSEIYKPIGVEVVILWDRKANENQLNNKVKNMSYYLIDSEFKDELPMYILLDGDKIIFKTSEAEEIIKRTFMLEEIGKDKLISSSNNYIRNIEHKYNGKKIVFFSMEGCSDCKKAKMMLNKEGIVKENKVVTIYTSDSNDEKKIIDYENVFANIYDIDWYPTFIKFDRDKYKIIRKTDDEQLLKELK